MASSSRSRRAEYREERAFIDADEIPKLVKGIDALLDVSSNPTSFENFEVRYSTKGDLQITGFNSCDRGNALACHGDPSGPRRQRRHGLVVRWPERRAATICGRF